MRTLRLWLVVLALLAVRPAAAEPSFVCAGGVAGRVSISADRTVLRITGRVASPSLDPLANGLRIEVVREPETDPGSTLFAATIPAASFVPAGSSVLYFDRGGALDGLIRVQLRGSRFRVRRRGGALPGPLEARPLRVVLSDAAGTACARTCGAECRLGAGLRCRDRRALAAAALCGIRSGCEVLGSFAPAAGGHCLLPYPSSFYEATDASTPTGKRLAYPRFAMPKNSAGVHIDPARWNVLDGYSPGTIVMAHFPAGVDLAASNVPPHTSWAASVDPASPTLLIEADAPGCQRVEHFGENDVSLGPSGPVVPPGQVFMIRPGRRLKNATRYVVALRGLRDQLGNPIAAPPAFERLRDGKPSGLPALEARRPAFEAMFAKLETDCGVARGDLVLAWDFTTASDEALTRILLSMRDQTFAQLGTSAPPFTVTLVEDDPFGDPRVCRRVRGTYQVPLFMTADAPGSLLNLDAAGLPAQNGTAVVPFTAIVPCSLAGPTPSAGRPIFYGHGLLGSGFGEVSASNLRTLAHTYGFVLAATDWQGMSSADLITILGFIGDLTDFPKLPERLHQGILNQLVLGHLLGAPDGLSAHPAFQYDDGLGNPVSVIDPSEVFYYGNSQGGIFGGTVMALTQGTTRGVLGVPAANFSTLLQRSVDFEPYFVLLRGGYPDDLERALTYPIIQQLWDRAEPNGWYHHTVPGTLPGTPPHQVLVHMATSDAEVANLATEIMVRSMGIPQVAPVVKSYYGIPEMTAPFVGSAMVESDGHYGPVPDTNVPPANNGAHGAMRALPAIQAQIDQFLRTGGSVQSFCSGPCDPD